MEELKFTEDHENQIVLITTPKRKHRIKVYVPIGNFAHWKISYEDGKPIEGLSEGVFLSRKRAMNAVSLWNITAKKTKDAKQFELFGDKEPPVLKRKSVSGTRSKTDTS